MKKLISYLLLILLIVAQCAFAKMSIEEARTLAFCSIVAFEWLMAFSARSDEHTVFRLGVFRNRALVISIGIAIILQMAVVYVPLLQTAFDTFPLTSRDWGIVVLASGGLFTLEEIRKAFFPRLYSLGKYKSIKSD